MFMALNRKEQTFKIDRKEQTFKIVGLPPTKKKGYPFTKYIFMEPRFFTSISPR